MLYAVQPFGHTAGLKMKRLSGTTSAQPGGWQAVKRGSSGFDTVTPMVMKLAVSQDKVETRLIVEKILAQLGGATNCVVRARSDVPVAVDVDVAVAVQLVVDVDKTVEKDMMRQL